MYELAKFDLKNIVENCTGKLKGSDKDKVKELLKLMKKKQSSNGIRLFCEYRYGTGKTDLDDSNGSCEYMRAVYNILWGRNEITNSKNILDENGYTYFRTAKAMGGKNILMGGDVANSVQTTLNKVLNITSKIAKEKYNNVNEIEELLDTMRYTISDIHGCYEEYKALLEKIIFSDEDELYVLGDVIDRGPEPIKILQDMMNRPNVIFLLGNYELMMYMFLKKAMVEITEENKDNQLSVEDLLVYNCWMENGGQVTIEQFGKLNKFDRQDMLDYIEEAFTYEIIEHNQKKYILVHAGLGGFEPNKDLEEYEVIELVEDRADYSRRYYSNENTFLVTGHTPTVCIPSTNLRNMKA